MQGIAWGVKELTVGQNVTRSVCPGQLGPRTVRPGKARQAGP